MTTGIRRPGQFSWINMLTSDTAKARDFFGKVLGWTYHEIPGMGHIVLVDGKEVGGLWDINSPQTPPGARPYIGVMVKVDSADATAAKVKSLGGDAKDAFDVMDQGRMAVCHDPAGAEFDIWQARNGPGMSGDARKHGMPSWFECLTKDVAGGKKFYGGLFGWLAETSAMPGGYDYTTFKLDGEYVGGMMGITPEMGAMKSHWGVYFSVDKVDDTVALATSLGGKVSMPAMDVPNVGRIVGLTSPQGVMFYAITNQ